MRFPDRPNLERSAHARCGALSEHCAFEDQSGSGLTYAHDATYQARSATLAPVGEWKDLGRSSRYEWAFGFKPLNGDEWRLADALVEQAAKVSPDEVLRREYFPSAEAIDRHFRGEAPEPLDPGARHVGVVNVYVNMTSLKSMWVDAGIAFGITLLTAGNPLPVVLTLVARAIASLQILKEDEAELVHVILGLSEGQAYRQSVPESRIRDAYEDAAVSVADLLDALIERKVAVRRHDGIRLTF